MYPTEVLIHYDVLRENFRAIQAHFPQKELAPIIKADAYGHDLLKTARAFLEGGARRLAVFRATEAMQLRDGGISAPVWCLLGPLPYEMEAAAALKDVTFGIYCREQMTAFAAAVAKRQNQVSVHLAVDTGMGRLGFLPAEIPAVLQELKSFPALQLRGVYSHMANPTALDHPVTKLQQERFRNAVKMLPAECTENHLCASNALLAGIAPELHYARPGICLYMEQVLPGDTVPATHDAMTLKSRIISRKTLPKGYTISYGCLRTLERDSIVGVIPVGYDDGYQRILSNQAFALVGGRRVPILGRVCMSMVMVDLTDLPDAKLGDEVVLLGSQGNEKITLAELTQVANTTEHEFLCILGRNRK